MKLPGGDVLPSFLGVERTPSLASDLNFDNYAIRIGEVVEILYPDDSRSRSKRFVEYRVLVQQRSNGTGNGKIYENVLLSNPLMGLADRMHWLLRVDSKLDKDGLGKGSKVLIACANAEQNTSWIITGVRDQTDDSDKKVKDLGHYFYANFNGMSFFVDKDGQFVITYGGKTEIDGKTKVSDNQTGSTLKFAKDGSIQLADKDAKNQLFIDHANSKVVIKRDTAFELGDATDYMLLGQSFRTEQKKMHNQVGQLLQQAGSQLSTAVGTAPGAPLPQVQAAGALIIAAAKLIAAFEQAADTKNSFLSQKNKAD